MAGGFNPIDPVRCEHYAGFASHLDRRSFDFIYWFLFAAVICMLFLSSWKYSGDLDKIQARGWEPGSHGYRKRMKTCMAVCGVYAAISVVAVVMEVYALMALQFCDGEDLMPLYWSTWTMMQVGSVIAIFGIMLAIFNSLRGRKNPPWALALGTPVLVVAGIGHAVHGAMRKRVQRVRSRSRGRRGAMSASSSSRGLDTVSMSREQTLRAEDSEKEEAEISAKFLGFTREGAPIIKFEDDRGMLEPDHGVVIGRGDGHVIVAFKKAMTIVNKNGSSSNVNSGSTTNLSRFGGALSADAAAAESPNPGSKSGGSGGGGGPRTTPSRPRSPVVRIAPLPTGAESGGQSPHSGRLT
ncbi:hypothetical protein C8A03DRAFT_40356 [Achaetomium macrosporum]|uniref:Uncharacterized protein n=1 Tax=Achaetomium macrosporum TaxID=79813 RepID=A0AAN7HEN7_9PEZI|nr:hypothetical protein C8A03DRAFT_40356 [Achaetomium macrosporum]